jgi:Flp pilus assembly pilin Flp
MGTLRRVGTYMRPYMQNESGQAVIEYVLVLAMVVSAITIMSLGFRKGISKLWVSMIKQVAPACPGCTPPAALQ